MSAKDLKNKYGDIIEKALFGIISGLAFYLASKIETFTKEIENLKIRTSVIEERINEIRK